MIDHFRRPAPWIGMLAALMGGVTAIDLANAGPILEQPTRRVSFQARLTDDNGTPLAGPSVDLEFRLYDGSGTLLDTVQLEDVPMNGGLVSTFIPLDPAFFDGGEREVGVRINGGPELSPRMPLTAVPHAYRVDRVRSDELDDFIALGSPAGSGVPGQNGYLSIYGGQATPAFTVDANLNTLSLQSDDQTGSTGMFAESGAGFVTALGHNEVNAYLHGGDGEVWATSSVNVGTIGTPLTDTAAYAALQFGTVFGGRLITYDEGRELSAVMGSSSAASEGGLVQLYRGGNGGVTVEIDGEDGTGSGAATWRNGSGDVTVEIEAGHDGGNAGFMTLRQGDADKIMLDSNAPRIRLFDPAGTETLRLWGNGGGGGGGASVRNSNGNVTVEIDGDESGSDAPVLRMRTDDGTIIFGMNATTRQFRSRANIIGLNDAGEATAELDGNANASGVLRLRREDGTLGVLARATEGTGSELNLYDSTGAVRIQIDTDWNNSGNSRIVADEVQITGGSDLSEQFDVVGHTDVRPGMVVSIDPDNPGRLRLSDEAHDRKVAGIVSCANGIKTGMYMGQRGTRADGAMPVALTGRVYCYVDAAYGPVQPGDMLTTSATPGHAMRVDNYDASQGAILGKAMTSLDAGRGLVLVLVNLQ